MRFKRSRVQHCSAESCPQRIAEPFRIVQRHKCGQHNRPGIEKVQSELPDEMTLRAVQAAYKKGADIVAVASAADSTHTNGPIESATAKSIGGSMARSPLAAPSAGTPLIGSLIDFSTPPKPAVEATTSGANDDTKHIARESMQDDSAPITEPQGER